MVHQLGQQGQRRLRVDQVVEEELLALLGVGPRLADDRVGHRQHLDRSSVAPALADALLLVLVVRAGDVDVGVAREDELGPAGREVAAPARRAGLHQQRAALGRPGDRERTLDPEPLAVVVERADLVGVGEDAGLAVEHEGVVVPRVPQPGGGLEELVGPVVAGVVAEVGVDPEVLRLAVVDRRDHVPRGPAARQVVERGERAGDVERRVVGRRVGGAEADVAGGAGHQAEHDAQVELHRAGAQAHGVGHRPAVDAGHRQPVVEEHHVEAALFEGAAELLVVAPGEEAVLGGGVAPRPRVDGDVAGLHEADQRHLPLAARPVLSCDDTVLTAPRRRRWPAGPASGSPRASRRPCAPGCCAT